MDEETSYKWEASGENESRDLDGSHTMAMEIINILSEIDRANKIIIDFQLVIHYADDKDSEFHDYECIGNDDEGNPVILETSALDHIKETKEVPYDEQLHQYLEKHSGRYEGYLSGANFKMVSDNVVSLMCKAYGYNLISALLHVPVINLENGIVHVDYFDINDLLKAFDLKYHVRYLRLRDDVPPQYVIDKLD